MRTPPRRLHARALGAGVAAACDAINQLSHADGLASGKNPAFVAGSHPTIPGVLWVESAQGRGSWELEPMEVIISRKTGESALLGGDIHRPGVVALTPGLRVGDRVSVLVDLDDRFLAFAPVKLLSTMRCAPAWLKGKWATRHTNAGPRHYLPTFCSPHGAAVCKWPPFAGVAPALTTAPQLRFTYHGNIGVARWVLLLRTVGGRLGGGADGRA